MAMEEIKDLEKAVEQNDNMLDGIINNGANEREVPGTYDEAEREADEVAHERIIEEMRSEDPDLEIAKARINEFCLKEYGDEADFSDLSDVSLAYTVLSKGELFEGMSIGEMLSDFKDSYEIQVSADLLQNQLITYVDGDSVRIEQYDSLAEMSENALSNLDFGSLMILTAPEVQELADSEINRISMEDLDRHEAEFGADGSRVFPHLNDEPSSRTEIFVSLPSNDVSKELMDHLLMNGYDAHYAQRGEQTVLWVDSDNVSEVQTILNDRNIINALTPLYPEEILASEIDEFMFHYDPYSYNDALIGDREDNIRQLAEDIRIGNTAEIKRFFNDILEESDSSIGDLATSRSFIERISDLEKSSYINNEKENREMAMSFDEFKDYVQEHIKEHLPEKYADADVSIQEVTKNNDTVLSSLSIRTEDSSVAPLIYLNNAYDDMQHGYDLEQILDKIANVRVSHEMETQDINGYDLNSITSDFDYVKDHIIPVLINAEMNENYLQDKPHTMVNDLAVVYKIDLGSGDGGRMTAPITNKLMEQYGVSVEELDSHAMSNLMSQSMDFKTMFETMLEMSGDTPESFMEKTGMSLLEFQAMEKDNPMYVLSNSEKLSGANMILDTGKMDEIAEKLGGDFIILPSSVHEVIILPVNDTMDLDVFNSMINEVNAGQVAPEERLSDKAYGYDSEKSLLVYASDLSIFKENEQTIEQNTADVAEKAEEALSEAEPDFKLTVSEKLVSEPFEQKQTGEMRRRVLIPNEDRNDKSPWASFTVPADAVSEAKDGKVDITLPHNGNKTIYKSKVVGHDQVNKPIFVNDKEKISTQDLMDKFDRLANPEKEVTTITFSEKLKGEPFKNKTGTELVSIKIPNEEKTDHSPWFEAVVPASHIKEAGNGKVSIEFPANAEITASRSVVQGVDEAGKKVYGKESVKLSVDDLKKRLEPNKTNIKDMIKSGQEQIQNKPEQKDKSKEQSRGGEAI